MAIDLILKELGVRDQVFITASGDITLPTDGLLNLALGADALTAARPMMGMSLRNPSPRLFFKKPAQAGPCWRVTTWKL